LRSGSVAYVPDVRTKELYHCGRGGFLEEVQEGDVVKALRVGENGRCDGRHLRGKEG
jgi:hypothetical protein